MDDDYDIYGDLDGFEVETQKENKVIKALKTEIEELKVKIAEKESEKLAIASENEILLENISSLLLTAKAELKRKDSLIADIRRQMDNNAFRRDRGNVRKHEQGTQTTMVRLWNQEVQTDSVGTTTESRRVPEERNKTRSPKRGKSLEKRTSSVKCEDLRIRVCDIRKEKQRLVKERTPVGRLSEIRRNSIQRWDKGQERDRLRERERVREREREREKERRARHREAGVSPEISPVRFSHPSRVTRQERGSKTDSSADAKLSQTFIPMNRKELDQYVKEIARKENRSPDELCAAGPVKKKKDTLDGSVELWDARLPKKKKEEPAMVKAAEENIIQSDEIGTTLSSPGNDVEQKMRVLHGESTTPESTEGLGKIFRPTISSRPPKLVIPPVEPPIIEQVPELPFEDDLRLNDSRELRIVESAETIGGEEQVDLEDGEIASDDEPVDDRKDRSRSPRTVSQGKENRHRETTKRQSKQDAPVKTNDSIERRSSRRDRKTGHPKQEVESKTRRTRSDRFDTSTPTRPHRRKSERPLSPPPAVIERRKSTTSRPSEPVKKNESKKETLKQLFGTDDENSLCELPTMGKRRPSGSREHSKDTKKQRHSKEKSHKDTGSAEVTESIVAPCAVDWKLPEIPSVDILEKIDSQEELMLMKAALEKTIASISKQEKPTMSLDTSQSDQVLITKKTSLSVKISAQDTCQDKKGEISVDVSQHDQPKTTTANSEEVPTESQPHDQSTQEAPKDSSARTSRSKTPAKSKRKLSTVDREEPKQSKRQRVRSSKDKNVKHATESIEVPCEVVREQAITASTDAVEKEDSLDSLVPKEVIPEEAPGERRHKEEVPIMNTCEVDEVSIKPVQPNQPLEEVALEETTLEVVLEQPSIDASIKKPSTRQRVRSSKDKIVHATEKIEVSCEVIREQAITASTDAVEKEDSLVPKAIIPEQTSSVRCHQEEAPIMDACELDEVLAKPVQPDQPLEGAVLEETALEVVPEQPAMDASILESSTNASQPEEPVLEILPQEDPVNTLPNSVSVNVPQPNEVPKSASSDEDFAEAQKQDQPTQEASQREQHPVGQDAYMEEIDQPSTHVSPEEVPEGTPKQDQTLKEVSDHPSQDAPPAETPIKPSQQQQQPQHKSPEVVFFNKYGEYRVEDNSETEITIYVTRTKKKKGKSNRAKLSSVG